MISMLIMFDVSINIYLYKQSDDQTERDPVLCIFYINLLNYYVFYNCVFSFGTG